MKTSFKKIKNVPINVPIKLAKINNDISSDVKVYIPNVNLISKRINKPKIQ